MRNRNTKWVILSNRSSQNFKIIYFQKQQLNFSECFNNYFYCDFVQLQICFGTRQKKNAKQNWTLKGDFVENHYEIRKAKLQRKRMTEKSLRSWFFNVIIGVIEKKLDLNQSDVLEDM